MPGLALAGGTMAVDSMATCLIALGSNLGDREATLQTALREIGAIERSRVVRHSLFHTFAAVGGAAQPAFLNAAAVVETQLTPTALFEHLVQIEMRHGRRRAERWAARTLDLDLLLFDDQVIDTPKLVVPHPRMSFRRFVLEPAAEIAGEMIHPTIGWSISQLAKHLNEAVDWTAIVSPSLEQRTQLSELATVRYGATIIESAKCDVPSGDENHWPARFTTWLAVPPSPRQQGYDSARMVPAGSMPKLTILVEAALADKDVGRAVDWSIVCQLRGRGPTLVLDAANRDKAAQEVAAAIETVWPHLGRPDATGIQ